MDFLKKTRNDEGFTLVELIIVIAIIAVLVAILAPNYVRYIDRSRWATDQSEADKLLTSTRTAFIEAEKEDENFINGDVLKVSMDSAAHLQPGFVPLKKYMDDADSNWSSFIVRHRHDQKLSGALSSDEAQRYNIYTIKYNDGSVTGVWSSTSR